MIKENELRRGNIVWDSYSGIMVVVGIKENGDNVSLRHINGITHGLYSLSDVEPIPLTAEILEGMDFIKDLVDESEPSEGYYYHRKLTDDKYCDLSLITGDKNGILEVCLFPYEQWFRCKYLHQLQNLAFSISGIELTYTPLK